MTPYMVLDPATGAQMQVTARTPVKARELACRTWEVQRIGHGPIGNVEVYEKLDPAEEARRNRDPLAQSSLQWLAEDALIF